MIAPTKSRFRQRRSTIWLLVAGLALTQGVGCGGGTSSPTGDASTDGEVDSATDAAIDATPDAAPDTCGNGTIEGDEICDGAELGSATCSGLGLPAGVLACQSDCTLDTSACAVCDDAICSDGETTESCPEDCGVVDIAAGATHSCAVLADGSVWCWGARDGHRMGGTGDVSEPVMLPDVNTAVAVAAGRHHTCIQTVLDEILCWGANSYGQVGEAQSHEVYPPVQIGTGLRVETGTYHTCVRRSPTETECWGRTWVGANSAQNPLLLPGVGHLVLGQHHTCYSTMGHLMCQGRNTNGQLGIGDNLWRESAVQITSTPMAALGAGANHTCGSVPTGSQPGLLCWGSNEFGQLGIPPGSDRLEPMWVSVLVPQLLDAGLRHTCAKVSPLAGPMLCWGHNNRGQLGNGTVTTDFEILPVAIPEVSYFDSGEEHVCAILPDQTARCWGDNRNGQIGNGDTQQTVAQPASPTRFGPEVAP